MSLDALQIFKTSSQGNAGLLEEKLQDSDFLICRTRPDLENTAPLRSRFAIFDLFYLRFFIYWWTDRAAAHFLIWM